MVKITKGNLENIVSKAAFDNYFASQGWVMEGVESPSKPILEVKEEPMENSDEEVNDEEWDNALEELQDEEVEKPLSDMNKDELISKANSLGIDISGLNTNKQLREAIKSYSK